MANPQRNSIYKPILNNMIFPGPLKNMWAAQKLLLNK